jgi:hypothetical protein
MIMTNEQRMLRYFQLLADNTGLEIRVYRLTAAPQKLVYRTGNDPHPSPERYERLAVLQPGEAVTYAEIRALQARLGVIREAIEYRTPGARDGYTWGTEYALVKKAISTCTDALDRKPGARAFCAQLISSALLEDVKNGAWRDTILWVLQEEKGTVKTADDEARFHELYATITAAMAA